MNTHSVWDWTLTGGVVGGLLGSGLGARFWADFIPVAAVVLFLVCIGAGLLIGAAGGLFMGIAAGRIKDPGNALLVNILIGGVTGFILGLPLLIVGAFITAPVGMLGGLLTSFLQPYRTFRWGGGGLVVLIIAAAFTQWFRLKTGQ